MSNKHTYLLTGLLIVFFAQFISAYAQEAAQTPIQDTLPAAILADSAYGELCTTSSCSANLMCKRDLWTPESTCCNANECAGNNACYTEYSCVNGPTKLCYNGGWIDVLNYEVNCVDGIDNDCDGVIDRADSDCYVPPVCGNGVCETAEDKTTCPADCGGDRYIIIRNDDVAPWWSTDNEIYVNDYIRNMGIPVSIGIIPSTNGGSIKLADDTKLVDYLTSIRNDPNVEISIHGLTHSTSEFQGIGRDASLSKITEAKNMFKTAISVDPVTFIPPYYEYDTDTLNAAKDAGMGYFSAGWNAVDMGHAFKENPAGLMNIPATTDIYNWGTGTFYTNSEIQSSCENAMARFGTCVIVVHHQLFVDQNNNIDPNKIAILNSIMQWVKSKESSGVKLKTIGNHKVLPPPTPQKKYIVFRNDDIAAYWDTSAVISVTELVRSKNVPQVLGLVSMNENDMLYDDPDLNNYLKSISTDNSFEFALHGYDHAENEFGSLTYEEALTKITDGTNALMTVVGKAPKTFVPPYNVYNDNTMVAVATVFKGLNPEATFYMSTLSSGTDDTDSGKAFKISVVSNSSHIVHLPQTTDFYNWVNDNFYTVQEITSSCDSALSTYNICIITLHPQTFMTNGKLDSNKLKILTDVIDWAKSKNTAGTATLARLMDINQNDLPCMKSNSCYN